MAADIRRHLHDAAGAPRFEVPVDELYGRALRARRRRHAAIASGAVAVVVAVAAAVFALLPDPDGAPVIAPTPPGTDGVTDENTGDDASDAGDPADDTDDTRGDEPDDADASGLLEGVQWVVNDLSGLRDHNGDVLRKIDALPAASAARDGEGGIVYTDANGLWWLPTDAVEPEHVREGEVGRILEVVVINGEHIARTTDAGDIVLASGDEAEAELPPLEGDEPQGPSITAANGLTAQVVGPEVERTPEGMIHRVVEPATLTIERDGEVELTVVIGTEDEPLARLHDFDGRRVVLTRFPEEPAMAPENVVAFDLDCPDCVEILATSSPAGVALVGIDVDWDGPLQQPRPNLISP